MDAESIVPEAELRLALLDDQTVDGADGAIMLRQMSVGNLVVPSGRLVACDPLWVEEEAQPFVQEVTPGRYPVILSIAHFPSGDQRVAYATVRLRDGDPIRWEIVRPQGVAKGPGDDDYVWSYDAETGTGCFMDATIHQHVMAEVDEEPAYAPALNDAITRNSVPTWGYANVMVEDESGANIMAFMSGFGDGAYLTYVGYDVGNAPLCFTTDFGVLGEGGDDD